MRTAGDRGLLLEFAGDDEAHAFAAEVRRRLGAELEEVVPGDSSLLLVWTTPEARSAASVRELVSIDPPPTSFEELPEVRIRVRYDGPDLGLVAAAAAVDAEAVAALHSAPTYRAVFTGFAPGFAYLRGGDPRLDLPRSSRPRAEVKAGSVAIAAGYSAVYPRASPAGWHVIGHTDATLFDLRRERPALIEPGARVIFEPV
jgi:KipI family sensor histidine kinase inhibitor